MPIARAIGVRTMCIVDGRRDGRRRGDPALHAAALVILGDHLPATCIGGFGGMLAYQSGMIAGLAHVDDADEGSASAALSFALQLGIGFGVARRRGGAGAALERARARGSKPTPSSRRRPHCGVSGRRSQWASP